MTWSYMWEIFVIRINIQMTDSNFILSNKIHKFCDVNIDEFDYFTKNYNFEKV